MIRLFEPVIRESGIIMRENEVNLCGMRAPPFEAIIFQTNLPQNISQFSDQAMSTAVMKAKSSAKKAL